MPLAGFEPTIPVFKRAKIFYALDRAATMTGFIPRYMKQMFSLWRVLDRHFRIIVPRPLE
jgi:hypothetical protein